MIVYASRIDLTDRDPRAEVAGVLCDWLSRKLRTDLDPEDVRQARDFGHGHVLQVEDYDGGGEWSVSWRYSHPDTALVGRTWHTGLGASSHRDHSFCTVLLHTEEQSTLVQARPETTPPRLVGDIRQRCSLHGSTPGGSVKTLTLDDASAFLALARDPDRPYPIVQVSHDRDGDLLLDPRRLAERCLGIALVAVIPVEEDTFELERELGRPLSCFGGALNVLWPAVPRSGSVFVPTTRMLADELLDFRDRGLSPERECLARICHYTNPGLARGHVSMERVRSQRLYRALEQAKAARSTDADPMLAALLEQVDGEQRQKIAALEHRISELERDLKAAEEEREEAQRKASALQDHLEARSLESDAGSVPEALRECMLRLPGTDPSLEDTLTLLSHLFADRLIVLPSAWQSAREAKGFQRSGKAFELLRALCTGYYDGMAAGLGDKAASQAFGPTSFAARESETVEGNKRARSLRTFVYRGRPIEMMRHLKIGVKDSVAETLRAHFHWDAEAKKVVLGHCGRHLDHG